MEEKKLILLLKHSPTEGLEKVIELYGGTVKWIVTKIIGHNKKEDIEECISDIFVKLWKNIDRVDERDYGGLRAYINGIARHTAIDYKRKNERQENTVSIDVISPDSDELGINIDFTNEFTQKINSEIIRKTVDTLPSPDKEIFIRRFFLGERIKEIAQNLDLHPKAVENKLYRGKFALKEALVERGVVL